MAQSDPLLQSHIERVRKHPGFVSHFTPELQNEFIGILASIVRKKLVCDIKGNKYHGILFDSIPNLAHCEQLFEGMRYVNIDFVNKKVELKESFLGYIKIHAKDAASIKDLILSQRIGNCRYFSTRLQISVLRQCSYHVRENFWSSTKNLIKLTEHRLSTAITTARFHQEYMMLVRIKMGHFLGPLRIFICSFPGQPSDGK